MKIFCQNFFTKLQINFQLFHKYCILMIILSLVFVQNIWWKIEAFFGASMQTSYLSKSTTWLHSSSIFNLILSFKMFWVTKYLFVYSVTSSIEFKLFFVVWKGKLLKGKVSRNQVFQEFQFYFQIFAFNLLYLFNSRIQTSSVIPSFSISAYFKL